MDTLQEKLDALRTEHSYWFIIASCCHADNPEMYQVDMRIADDYARQIYLVKQEMELQKGKV